MTLKIFQKYRVKIQLQVPKRKRTFYDLAAKHIVKTGGKVENLSLDIDKVLYGKK